MRPRAIPLALTKISCIDGLPFFLTHGALRGAPHAPTGHTRSAAIKISHKMKHKGNKTNHCEISLSQNEDNTLQREDQAKACKNVRQKWVNKIPNVATYFGI